MNKTVEQRLEELERRVEILMNERHYHSPVPNAPYVNTAVVHCSQCGQKPPTVCMNVACPAAVRITC